uniref:OTU domain-containing protein n=1 Tax=Chromera velia CCMP2878 TaxID=1169474 RepID=A0A0G4F278_9ALVE|eukprot:Cvel_14679.t1-p1 / transcript=Cvel_14679.t1 / gene=Cvel_14679 / organism=Chromera_velia_CCMP2878 / gene_product=hypothetical protein / transcript_product=hypothetical protein / location=Cvel_scaffold1053:4531-11179(+) / protein_length=357 / sequence_SO=supercontig / SO=protein_coding / is_pseudo=false
MGGCASSKTVDDREVAPTAGKMPKPNGNVKPPPCPGPFSSEIECEGSGEKLNFRLKIAGTPPSPIQATDDLIRLVVRLERSVAPSTFVCAMTKMSTRLKKLASNARMRSSQKLSAASQGSLASVPESGSDKAEGEKESALMSNALSGFKSTSASASASATPASSRAAEPVEGMELLGDRLKHVDCEMVKIGDDGNCLFRSCSWNLFGTEDFHAYVRHCAVSRMWEERGEFGAFLGEEALREYLREMAEDRTWGDELSVRAVADYFGCTVHIVTTNKENWYLKYLPSAPVSRNGADVLDEPDKQKKQRGSGKETQSSSEAPAHSHLTEAHLFLTYISPVHYNAFRQLSPIPCDEDGGG